MMQIYVTHKHRIEHQLVTCRIWPLFSVGKLKTKEGSQNSTIQGVVVKKELLNQSHLLHLTKMGTHSFRAPEKEAVNLKAKCHPLQIHGFTCKLVVHDQL